MNASAGISPIPAVAALVEFTGKLDLVRTLVPGHRADQAAGPGAPPGGQLLSRWPSPGCWVLTAWSELDRRRP